MLPASTPVLSPIFSHIAKESFDMSIWGHPCPHLPSFFLIPFIYLPQQTDNKGASAPSHCSRIEENHSAWPRGPQASFIASGTPGFLCSAGKHFFTHFIRSIASILQILAYCSHFPDVFWLSSCLVPVLHRFYPCCSFTLRVMFLIATFTRRTAPEHRYQSWPFLFIPGLQVPSTVPDTW